MPAFQKMVMLLVVCMLTMVLVGLYKTAKDRTKSHNIEFLKTHKYKLGTIFKNVEWTSTKVNVRFQAFLEGSELEEGVKSGQAYEELHNNSILPHSARIVAKKIFHTKPLVIWATEWHMTPIKDITNLLTPFGVHVKDYNLDPWRCEWHNCSAKKGLKVLTSDNVLDLKPPLEDEYIKAYQNDAEMASVDVVYCGYPASLCQVYHKLNKSVIIQASTRYDVGRYTADRLNQMNEDYRKLAKKHWNVISGNNLYDAQFIRYYSGVNTHHMPSVCDYTGAEYNNTNPHYLIFRRRDNGFTRIFLESFNIFCKSINCTVQKSDLPGYTYESLASYKGVVHVPYQVSVMSIFEQYRMNMPMFVPSPQLLAHWQVNNYIMPERSFEGAFFGQRTSKSVIPPHPSQKGVPDPKDEYNFESTLHWMKMADFYQVFPHAVIYESVPHLVHILNTISNQQLQQISSKMRAYNVQFKKKLLRKWRAILLNIAQHSPNHPH